jgi:hypothetical protein
MTCLKCVEHTIMQNGKKDAANINVFLVLDGKKKKMPKFKVRGRKFSSTANVSPCSNDMKCIIGTTAELIVETSQGNKSLQFDARCMDNPKLHQCPKGDHADYVMSTDNVSWCFFHECNGTWVTQFNFELYTVAKPLWTEEDEKQKQKLLYQKSKKQASKKRSRMRKKQQADMQQQLERERAAAEDKKVDNWKELAEVYIDVNRVHFSKGCTYGGTVLKHMRRYHDGIHDDFFKEAECNDKFMRTLLW